MSVTVHGALHRLTRWLKRCFYEAVKIWDATPGSPWRNTCCVTGAQVCHFCHLSPEQWRKTCDTHLPVHAHTRAHAHTSVKCNFEFGASMRTSVAAHGLVGGDAASFLSSLNFALFTPARVSCLVLMWDVRQTGRDSCPHAVEEFTYLASHAGNQVCVCVAVVKI